MSTPKKKQLHVGKVINFLLRQEFGAYQIAAKDSGKKEEEILDFESWLHANDLLQEELPSEIILPGTPQIIKP